MKPVYQSEALSFYNQADHVREIVIEQVEYPDAINFYSYSLSYYLREVKGKVTGYRVAYFRVKRKLQPTA